MIEFVIDSPPFLSVQLGRDLIVRTGRRCGRDRRAEELREFDLRPPPKIRVNDRNTASIQGRVPQDFSASSVEGIEKYLASGMIRGIGPVYAKRLSGAFGEKVFDVIEADHPWAKFLPILARHPLPRPKIMQRYTAVSEAWIGCAQ
jgi:hypothetical protein